MTGQIINRKKTHRLGFVSWYMRRPLDDCGRNVFEYVVHFSPEQVEQCGGRPFMARALRRARNDMQESIRQQKARMKK